MVWKKLREQGEKVSLVCGALNLDERQKELIQFMNSACHILLTTDVCARGLDISDTKAVVNYDLPHSADMMHPNPKLFLSRISRAGRLCKGMSVSLLNGKEHSFFKKLAHYYEFSPKEL